MGKMKQLITVLMVCTIVLGGTACIKKDKQKMNSGKTSSIKNVIRRGNSNANIANGGIVDEAEGWIYYSLPDGLYKVKKDGSEKQKLVDDKLNAGFYDINVIDNDIYYRSMGIYKTDIKGDTTKQITAEDVRGGVHFVDGWIQYGNKIRMKYDGSDMEKIYDSNKACGYTLNIVDGWIYYYDSDSNGKDGIFKMRLDGSEQQKIFEGNANNMIVEGDWIYFQNHKKGKRLYKMKTDGSDIQLIVNDEVMSINVTDGWIYYNGNNSLNKIKVDGTEQQKLCMDNSVDLCVIDEWIYYKINGESQSLYRVKTDGSEQQQFATIGEVTKIADNNNNDNKQTKATEKLVNTYTTKFGEVNAITYPSFIFNYPDDWVVSKQNVTSNTEMVTLTDGNGCEIKYCHYGYPKDYSFGGSSISMLRVNVSEIADSNFIPSYVQETDYSKLGKFVVAKLKVTGELNMKTDSDFKDIDGSVAYAVVPKSYIGTREDVRGMPVIEFAFYYSGHISFTCEAPKDGFTEEQENTIIKILKSFRVKK